MPSVTGGRQNPPTGNTYSTVARFEDIKDGWPDEAWSIMLEFNEEPDEDGIHYAEIHFLVENAPHEILYEGSKFDLFEGYKLVAKGIVIPNP